MAPDCGVAAGEMSGSFLHLANGVVGQSRGHISRHGPLDECEISPCRRGFKGPQIQYQPAFVYGQDTSTYMGSREGWKGRGILVQMCNGGWVDIWRSTCKDVRKWTTEDQVTRKSSNKWLVCAHNINGDCWYQAGRCVVSKRT